MPLDAQSPAPLAGGNRALEGVRDRRDDESIDEPTLFLQAPDERVGGDEFVWGDGATVIHQQPRTACYLNANGQLVIRQERGPLEDEDPFLYFNIESVPALIAALKAALEA